MRTEVLQVDRFPEMTFVSRSLVASDSGFRIDLEVTMHGAARTVPVDVKVEMGGDTVRATGGFSVKHSDFGMRRFRGGPGGSVKGAHRLTFDFEAGAGRAPQRPRGNLRAPPGDLSFPSARRPPPHPPPPLL